MPQVHGSSSCTNFISFESVCRVIKVDWLAMLMRVGILHPIFVKSMILAPIDQWSFTNADRLISAVWFRVFDSVF